MINLTIREYQLIDYFTAWRNMCAFTRARNKNTPDELWLLQHPPTYTLGYNGKHEHIIKAIQYPLIHTDRGGQITYHGPGQLVGYFLIDLNRSNLTVRGLVQSIESIILQLLNQYNIEGHLISGAPGLYVHKKKICSLGLRIQRGCSYHGFALNVNMNLLPFEAINPCGYQKLTMTHLADFISNIRVEMVIPQLLKHVQEKLGYTMIRHIYYKENKLSEH